jgi:hypothetical protein
MKTKRIAKKFRMLFLLSFLILSLSTCIGGFGFVFKEHLFGNYYLVATDVIEDCALSYHTENDKVNFGGTVIGETVFAVGYNEKYLIAKQYYHTNREYRIDEIDISKGKPIGFNGGIEFDWEDHLDKSKIKYYILPLKEGMDWRTNNGLIGTTDSLAFENMRKELGISDLKFTRVIDIP